MTSASEGNGTASVQRSKGTTGLTRIDSTVSIYDSIYYNCISNPALSTDSAPDETQECIARRVRDSAEKWSKVNDVIIISSVAIAPLAAVSTKRQSGCCVPEDQNKAQVKRRASGIASDCKRQSATAQSQHSHSTVTVTAQPQHSHRRGSGIASNCTRQSASISTMTTKKKNVLHTARVGRCRGMWGR